MAMQLSCRDLGIACRVVLSAENEAELLRKVAEHVLANHGIDLKQAGMLEAVRAAIHSSRVLH